MHKITEIQRFRDNHALFIALLLVLNLPIVLIIAEVVQLGMANDEWLGLIFTLTVLLIAGILLITMKTQIQLRADGILYRDNPFLNKHRYISHKDIVDCYIAPHRKIHALFKVSMSSGQSHVMRPGNVLVVKMNDGREYRFGINRPVLVQKFIDDHWTEKRNSYG